MSADPHTGHAGRMVCDCWAGDAHVRGCVLGQAEGIAWAGLREAAADTHPLVSALIALTADGLLAPDAGDPDTLNDILMGLCDQLYEAGMLIPPTVGGA